MKPGGKAHFVLAGNGPYANRGCEAIVRGTTTILEDSFGACQFTNAYFDPMNPLVPQVEPDESIATVLLPWGPGDVCDARFGVCRRIYGHLPYRIRIRDPFRRLFLQEYGRAMFAKAKSAILECSAVLSVGGDNYSFDYGVPDRYLALNRFVKRLGVPLILWGTSLGGYERDPRSAQEFLRSFEQDVSAVFVRERQTYAFLKRSGFKGPLHLMPDPAFLMEPRKPESEVLGFRMPDNAIGLNLSPLLAKFAFQSNLPQWRRVAVNIVDDVRRSFGLPIVLIPHVTVNATFGDDHTFLSSVRDAMPGPSEEVFLVPRQLTAAEMKWVISRLRCLAAARTHATIAGFSTGTPTVSLAYSLKAHGLNETIFGHEHYVVPLDALAPETVCSTLGRVIAEDAEIREHLSRNQALARSLASEAADRLAELLG